MYSVSFLGLSPPKASKTVSFFVSFHRGATQSGILFLVSIERGTSRRVYHRRPWLSDMSQLGGAPCRFLARPGCGTRRCVGPTRETWFQCVRPGRQAIEDGKHPVRCYRAEYRLAGPKAVFTIDTEMGAVRAPVSCGPHRAGVYRSRSTMARCQGPAAGDRRPDGLPGPVFAGGDYGRVAQASIRDRDRPHLSLIHI